MEKRDSIKIWFAIVFLVAIPALIHALFEGAYKIGGVYWIGAISTTIPYLFLALLFFEHCVRLKSKSRRSACCGAVMAWLGMMGFTTFLVFQAPGPKYSSTIGIAVGMTPFFYIPFLLLPYIVGTIVGVFWSKWKP
jgi:hypothetical protein